MTTQVQTRQQTVPTTTFVVERPQNFSLLEERFRLMRYVLPDTLLYRKNPTDFGRVHNTLRKEIDYPYKSFTHDRLEGKRRWAVYVLYPRQATIQTIKLPWFEDAALPCQEVAFDQVPLHLLVKLLQIRLFRGEEGHRFIGQDKCYVYARAGKDDFHYCVEVEIKGSRNNTDEPPVQEFRIIPHARRFGKVDPPFQPSRTLFGKRPFEDKFVFLHLKPGAEAQETTVYDIITFPGKRASVKFHNPSNLNASKGKIVFDFSQQFLASLNRFGIPASPRERTFTLARMQKNVQLPITILQAIGVFDNRLQRTHSLTAYIEVLNSIRSDVHFVPVNDIQHAPKGGMLVLLDVKAEDFAEDGILSNTDYRDPYGRLYAEYPNIPKQSVNVNMNDPNALAGGDYLDYPLIQAHDDDFEKKIDAVLNELYLKCAILYGLHTYPLPFITNDLAFIRRGRYDGKTFTTALWFDNQTLHFASLGDNQDQSEQFYALLDRWRVDWDEQYEALLKERRRIEEDNTIKDLPVFDIIVGPDLFIAIEDLEERVLYNYHEISRRQQEQKQMYSIEALKLAPYYDEIKQKNMLTFAQLSQSEAQNGRPESAITKQSLLFYQRLVAYDTLLDEIALTHPSLSYRELTSGEWLERIAHIFESKANDEGKYHRRIIAGLYNKRHMFLSERGDNVQLYQGIWHDDTNAFLVGSPTSMNTQGQERAHLIRRFQIMQGSSHFNKE